MPVCELCEFDGDLVSFAPQKKYPSTVCLGCSPYYTVSWSGEMVLIDELPPHMQGGDE